MGTDRIPLSEPSLDGNELAYLTECVETNWLSSAGAFVSRFEEQLARHVFPAGDGHGVAMVNGTAALHLALKVAGVGAGDEVLVSSLSFIAAANAIAHAGAVPVFVDAEPDTWQMDTSLATDFLQNGCEPRDGGLYNKASGRRIGAVLPVHILGHPVHMEPLMEAARQFGLPVIEDATESLGSGYGGKPVGSLGDIACFSFNGNKLVTSGGGGMIVTRNGQWAAHARHLSTQARSDAAEYIHDEVGYNYRLTNLQAAVGVAQMERIGDKTAAKARIAAKYRDMADNLPGITYMPTAAWADNVCWLSSIRVDAAVFGLTSRELRAFLAEKSIETRSLWQPLHKSPAYAGCQALGGAVAERLYGESLSLPSSPGLPEKDQDRVIAALRDASQASR
ncbi:MAG: LegC family aminotransferase [Alphaproteobacteria bacterium]